MSMDERLTVMNEAPTKQLTFADLQALPTSKNKKKASTNHDGDEIGRAHV